MVALTYLPTAVLFTLFTTATAQTLCTTTNAIPAESLNTGNTGSSNAGSGSANTVGLDFDLNMDLQNSLNEATTNGANLIANSVGRKIKRADLICTSTEICFSISKTPLCVNPKNGDYHVPGEKGNIVSGNFVLNDGRRGNLYSSATAVPTGSTNTRVTAAGSTPTAAPGAGTAAATQTTTGGAMGNKAGSVAMVLALSLGILLQ